MKKTKLFLVSFLLIVGPVLIESCCWDCDCARENKKRDKFSIKDIDMAVGVRYSTPFLLAPHTITAGNLEFLFEMETETALNLPSFRPTMAAYACVHFKQSIETVQTYSVISNNTLVTDQGTFAAGQDLSTIFFLTDGGKDTPFHDVKFNLYPSFKAKEKGEHAFTFSFTLDDGRHFEFESSSFELLTE